MPRPTCREKEECYDSSVRPLSQRLRLPIDVDVDRLAAEVRGLERDFVRFAPGPFDVKGWDGIALISADGRVEDTRSPAPSRFGPLPAAPLARCPHHAELLASLGAPVLAARLLYLEPDGLHALHRDPIGFPLGGIRIHLPVQSHPDVELWLGGERMCWAPGELWYGDFAYPHRLANPTDVMRVHLVVDLAITEAVLALFPPEVLPSVLDGGVCHWAPTRALESAALERFEGRWHLPRRFLVAVDAPETLHFACVDDARPGAERGARELVALRPDGTVAFALDPLDDRTLALRGYYPGVTFELAGDRSDRNSNRNGGLDLVHRGRVYCDPSAEGDERSPWELYTSRTFLEPLDPAPREPQRLGPSSASTQ